MERYQKRSIDYLHQSPNQREIEKRTEDGKKDGGHQRKLDQEGENRGHRGKVDEWMEQAVPS